MAIKRKQLVRRGHNNWGVVCYQSMLQALKYVSITLGILGLIYGNTRAKNYFYRLPYFKISKIEITGNNKLSEKQIKKLGGIDLNQNIFSVKLKDVSKNLTSHPYIEYVLVERKFPQIIKINIKERKGVAILKTPWTYYLMDIKGVVLENLGLHNKGKWPVIEGANLKAVKVGGEINQGGELLRFLQASGILDNFVRLDVGETNNPILVTRGEEIKVYLGKEAWDKKFKRFNLVYKGLRARAKSVKSIDLRYKQMVIVKRTQDA